MLSDKKIISLAQAQEKLARFCAYQDRCEYEVRQKAKSFDLNYSQIDELVDFLIDERYLDEERFVSSFVRGKFNLKRWGKQKIKAHLNQKRVPDSLVEKHLEKISEKQYLDTIEHLIEKKENTLAEDNPFKKNQKIILHLQQKGFELESIFKVIKNERPD